MGGINDPPMTDRVNIIEVKTNHKKTGLSTLGHLMYFYVSEERNFQKNHPKSVHLNLS